MDKLIVRVKMPFGYHSLHLRDEIIAIQMCHAQQLILGGFVEIVVNNVGNNTPHNEYNFKSEDMAVWEHPQD